MKACKAPDGARGGGKDLYALPRVGAGRHDDAVRQRLRMIGI
jgi:hypothetical protein